MQEFIPSAVSQLDINEDQAKSASVACSIS